MSVRWQFLLALVVSIGACGGIGDIFKEPDIQLERVVVRGVGLTGGNLDLIVKVDNPNGFTLQGTKLQLGFDVEGQHLGDITYDDDFAVPENGTTTITLPLKFGWAGVGSAVRAALGCYPRGTSSADPLGREHRNSRTISMTRKVPLSDH